MFDKNTYIRRRAELKKLVGKGIIIIILPTRMHPCVRILHSFTILDSIGMDW